MWQILSMLKSRGVIGILNFLVNMNDRAFIMLVAHTYHKNAALELCVTSATRLGDLLDFGQLFKAFGND